MRGLGRATSRASEREFRLVERRGRELRPSRGRRLGLSRGLSLFGSLLALGLLGTMVLAAALFFDSWMLDKRAALAARQLTVLSDAAASHVSGRFPALLAAADIGPVELTVGALRTAGALPAGFPDVNALGRGHRVLMLSSGAGALDLLVTQTVPTDDTPSGGDTVVPAAALLDGARRRTRWMGSVAPGQCRSRLDGTCRGRGRERLPGGLHRCPCGGRARDAAAPRSPRGLRRPALPGGGARLRGGQPHGDRPRHGRQRPHRRRRPAGGDADPGERPHGGRRAHGDGRPGCGPRGAGLGSCRDRGRGSWHRPRASQARLRPARSRSRTSSGPRA